MDGNLILTDGNRKNILNPEAMEVDIYGNVSLDVSGEDGQKCLCLSGGYNEEILTKYILSKNPDLDLNPSFIKEWKDIDTMLYDRKNEFYLLPDLIRLQMPLTNKEMNKIINDAKEKISNGENVGLFIGNFDKLNPIKYLKEDGKVLSTSKLWDYGSAHVTTVTGITDEEFITSTWGIRATVPFEDLQYSGAFYMFSWNIE